MKTFRIVYTGTVIGEVIVEAKNLNNAIKKSDEMPIDIVEYPNDWKPDFNTSEEVK